MNNTRLSDDKYKISIITDTSKREQTKHGTADFPLVVYRDSLRFSTLGYINWHWHPELQYVLVTEGIVQYSVGSAEITLNPGDGLLINSGRLHMARSVPGTDGTYICIDFHASLLSSFAGSVYDQKYVQPFLQNDDLPFVLFRAGQAEDQQIICLFQSVIDAYEAGEPRYEIDVLCALLQAWKALLNKPEVPVRQTGSPLTMAIMAYISDHLGEPLTLEGIAAAVSFSPAECCRQFRSTTGETIFSYIRKCRLEYGMHLLLNSEQPVSDIAYAAGFSSTSYFIQNFRELTGTTPHQYRRIHKPA